MQLLRGLGRFFRFVADPDTFCLVWLAIRNHVKKPITPAPEVGVPRRKRAGAGNAV